MSKILYVSSAVQAALMSQVFIPELADGFWKNHRPQGHGEVWRDVEVRVSDDGTLGPVGFDVPRNYNFLNLTFFDPNEARLVGVAQSAKANSTSKSVKKELIELGRIVGSRLASREATPVKLFRGNHKPGTVTVSSRARTANATLGDSATTALMTTIVTPEVGRKPSAKRTVTKTKHAPQGAGVAAAAMIKDKLEHSELTKTVTHTAQGAKVTRVAVAPLPTIFDIAEGMAE